ncbi:MAG: putative O-glycosylation ligase, exosortase A system-associated [Pseudomonadota bacterium]
MRDLVITLAVLGALPFVFKRPYIGILLWVWISVMNPHRLSWGFAYDFPFAQLIAVTTLISLFFRKEKAKLTWSAPMILLLIFVFWMSVSTLFALVPKEANIQWGIVIKIMFMIFVTMVAVAGKRQIELLVWALALSLGFYGVKGGLFTLMGGATDTVYGPPSSYIEENNALAMALLMTVPLIWYLRNHVTKTWLRLGLLGAMGLCLISALGSYSRGALLALFPMVFFLWLKSRNKAPLAFLIILLAPLMFSMMPEKWFTRMETISTYDEDESAMGRINAWQTAFNIAKDRPLVGGGFQLYEPQVFLRYSPNPENVHAAHSIYFAALGEHGFVGLGLFLMLGVATWRTASWVVRHSKTRSELSWASDLGLMIQVSLVGYAVGGAFLSVLYFDLPYYLLAILVLLKKEVQKTLAQKSEQTRAGVGTIPVTMPLK